MEPDTTAQAIMREFATSTGLSGSDREARRYLWTDAFAVCNYLGLFQETGDQALLGLATRLVDQVHEQLARHRRDSRQSGWLSGLPEEEARIHPTCAGLRIGKPLDERQAGEPEDDTLEWQQDGQYFHYLTRWMHALNRVGQQTRNPAYHRWAVELAQTAHRSFVYRSEPGGPMRMYWKMSIDLSRPLVRSMGHHDPLDALVSYLQLEATTRRLAGRPGEAAATPSLQPQIEDFSAMCAGRRWATGDDLGIGCLLIAACHLAQLLAGGSVEDTGLLETLLTDSASSLHAYTTANRLGSPAEYRLAFREFGLAIGLQAVATVQQSVEAHPQRFDQPRRLTEMVSRLQAFCGMSRSIVEFWLAAPHRTAKSWLDHADINTVMLATSLAPEGYLLP
jgi:hypothetical protein